MCNLIKSLIGDQRKIGSLQNIPNDLERLAPDPRKLQAEIARLDARVIELLEANNREVERRRALAAAVRMAQPLLERERQTIVECHSSLEIRDGDDEPQPVPGTLEPGAVTEAVAEYDAAIEACKNALDKLKEGR